MIALHIKTTRRLLCASQRKGRPRSYGMGYAVHTKSMGALDDPCTCVAIGEDLGHQLKYWSVLPLSYPVATCSNVYIDPRHNGGLNLGFADGHCKWIAKSATEGTSIVWE